MAEKTILAGRTGFIWKISIISLLIIIFSILLAIFYEKTGSQIFIFYFIPVALCAFYFGPWPALIMETALIFLGTTLLAIVFKKPIFGFFFQIIKTNPVGIISHYCFIALLGFVRDQQLTIKKLNREIIRIRKTDELTSLYNRRAILEEANRELSQTLRNLDDVSFYMNAGKEKAVLSSTNRNNAEFKSKRGIEEYIGVFTCVLFDIDHFKKINDTYCHLMGDNVLQKIGTILKEECALRKSDMCGRYGGGEFLILLPGTSARNSLFVINRIMEKIKAAEFTTGNGTMFSITVSAGISQFNKGDREINDIIVRADAAMYYAKQHGRDQVVIYDEKCDEIEKSIR